MRLYGHFNCTTRNKLIIVVVVTDIKIKCSHQPGVVNYPPIFFLSYFLLFLVKIRQFDNNCRTSFCSYARSAQPGPNRTRLCGPCIAAIAGD